MSITHPTTETSTYPAENSLTNISPIVVGALRDEVRGGVITERDPHWEEARQAWNLAIDQQFRAVVRVEDAADIVAAVRFARRNGFAVTAQPLGHGATHQLAGTILLRTSGLQGLHVNAENRFAQVEAGVMMRGFLAAVSPHGLTPRGPCAVAVVTSESSRPSSSNSSTHRTSTVAGSCGTPNSRRRSCANSGGRRKRPGRAQPLGRDAAIPAGRDDSQIRHLAIGIPMVPELVPAIAARNAELSRVMAPWTTNRVFFSFLGERDIEHAYPPATLARLRTLKLQRDPSNVIRSNHPPSGAWVPTCPLPDRDGTSPAGHPLPAGNVLACGATGHRPEHEISRQTC